MDCSGQGKKNLGISKEVVPLYSSLVFAATNSQQYRQKSAQITSYTASIYIPGFFALASLLSCSLPLCSQGEGKGEIQGVVWRQVCSLISVLKVPLNGRRPPCEQCSNTVKVALERCSKSSRHDECPCSYYIITVLTLLKIGRAHV